jgi:hypothetical protein
VITLILAASVLGAVAIVAYGIRKDSLPSKSLTFRWHYWTAASTLIRQSPLTGVGLNNFGEHYITVKRPSTPEDVSDPHSFFVRFAAEAGVPVAILVATLILWQLLNATRRAAFENVAAPPPPIGWPVFVSALACCAVWWIAHFYLADAPYLYNVYLLGIFALVTAGAAWGARVVMQTISAGAVRAMMLAALAGAFAMLIYDQINMALVTGPVAMLFWIMLGAADSYDPPAGSRAGFAGWPIAVACVAAAVPPLLLNRLDINPAPYEYRYIQLSQPSGNSPAALAALDSAIARDPRNIELLTQRVLFKQRMKLPIADDIRQILQLDRANARPRIMLAKPESDLPPAERAKILEEALRLDLDLPADEPKRLPAAERAEVEGLIEKLKATK